MPVASPCISICKIDKATHVCTGCHRKMDEISEWRTASEKRKQQILQLAKARKTRARGD